MTMKKLLNKLFKKKLLIALTFFLAAVFGWFLWHKNSIEIIKEKIDISSASLTSADNFLPIGKVSPISGLPCENALRRPMAVMLSGDAVVRPLSGISEADLIINMEVITGSITRLMAVFVCGSPGEIGSIRSARHDFITLARGLDAIYAHWGGSHFALEELAKGVIDNLDALPNRYSAFYRKSGIAAPHNGFTSMTRLFGAAQKMGYRLESEFIGYPHLLSSNIRAGTAKILTINYSSSFKVVYEFDSAANSYLRWRNGKKEIDKNNGQQIAAKNVVIMRAGSRQIDDQYNDVQVTGQGQAVVYRGGEEIVAVWKKDAKNLSSKLYFYDSAGEEIKFVPGQIWIEVVELGQSVVWE